MIPKKMGAAKAPNNEKQQFKDSKLKAVYDYLKNNTATATKAAVALNIYRPSLCRRKRTLQKAGLLVEVNKTICPVTKHRAAYLSTNIENIIAHNLKPAMND